MPNQPTFEQLKTALALGVMDQIPEQEKKKFATLVSYILTKEGMEDLQKILENAHQMSTGVNYFIKDAYLMGNLCCAGGGLAIGGVSLIKCVRTKNVLARICYGAGTVCGGVGAVAGSCKAFAGTCGLSFYAVAGDTFGGACLYVGNEAQKLGDRVAGKGLWSFSPKNFFRRPSSKTGMGYRGMSFVTSSGHISFEGVQEIIENIPYETIIIIGGTVFTVYGYVKICITLYRSLKSRFGPKTPHSKLIQKSALFLIDSINNTNRIHKIYLAAIKLHYSNYSIAT